MIILNLFRTLSWLVHDLITTYHWPITCSQLVHKFLIFLWLVHKYRLSWAWFILAPAWFFLSLIIFELWVCLDPKLFWTKFFWATHFWTHIFAKLMLNFNTNFTEGLYSFILYFSSHPPTTNKVVSCSKFIASKLHLDCI